MNFFEYLFSKYYNFQVRLGNGGSDPFGTIMFISVILMFYYASLLSFFSLWVSKDWLITNHFFDSILLSPFCFATLLYFLLLRKGKHKKILKAEAEKKKSSLGAILFALMGFLLLYLGWYFNYASK